MRNKTIITIAMVGIIFILSGFYVVNYNKANEYETKVEEYKIELEEVKSRYDAALDRVDELETYIYKYENGEKCDITIDRDGRSISYTYGKEGVFGVRDKSVGETYSLGVN